MHEQFIEAGRLVGQDFVVALFAKSKDQPKKKKYRRVTDAVRNVGTEEDKKLLEEYQRQGGAAGH